MDPNPTKSKYPKARRLKSDAKDGKLDDDGNYRTPNGSFWDVDNEYFNREGFDIHGGFYTKDFEYIEGPDWIPELGCYADEKEKYTNINWEEELLEEDVPNDIDEADLHGDFDGCNIEDLLEEEEANEKKKKTSSSSTKRKPKRKR